MPDGKQVVTQAPIVEQETAPVDEVNQEALVNKASELGHTLDFGNDVTPGNLDWSEMEPLQEFDQIAAERGVGEQSQEPHAASEDQQPAQDVNLTDGMSKRITDLKRKGQQEIAGKDSELAEKDLVIAAREEQIQKLTDMAQQFETLQSSYVPPAGDIEAINAEIVAMDQRLEDEGDVFTPAEVARHVQGRQDLVNKQAGVAQAQQNAQNIVQKQDQMRLQSDQYVKETYSFVSDPNSEYYKTLKTKAYPMLENIIGPNFKNHPQDMVLAAELSKLMVDAAKYNQITGNSPAPRAEAIPMAGNVTPQGRTQQSAQPSFRDSVGTLRGGSVDNFAKLLQQRGHTWRP
jgi:hypothetical protein|tara:strand:- start:8060 stop:9097 length:1038 start_codon:yes stop_codon:yes gene_type:complete